MGIRAMPEGPVRRFRRVVVRGRGSKRFFLGLLGSFSSSFLLLLLLAGGPPSIPGGMLPILLFCGVDEM